jgi:hypothetical protein
MRKYVIAVFLIIVVVAVVIISVLQANTGADVVTEDFEGDIGDWAVKGYVPQDPNNPGQTVEWHIYVCRTSPAPEHIPWNFSLMEDKTTALYGWRER